MQLSSLVAAVFLLSVGRLSPEPAFRDTQSPSRLRDKVVRRDEHADVATQSVTRVNAFGQPEWSEQLESNAAVQAKSGAK